MPPTDRLALPKAPRPGRVWLPSLGMCTVEPLPGGWLSGWTGRAAAGPRDGAGRVVLDLSRPRRCSVDVSGRRGSWTRTSPPPCGTAVRPGAEPGGPQRGPAASDIFEDPTRTVTVRAEMSRLRRYLAEVLAHRPYRFSEDVRVEVVRRRTRTASSDLLPGQDCGSSSPVGDKAESGPGEPREGRPGSDLPFGKHRAPHECLLMLLSRMSITVTTWSLEQTSLADLRPAAEPAGDVTIVRAEVPSPEFSRFL